MTNFTVKDVGSEELKNFFNIFGFVKVSGFFSEEIKTVSREFNDLMTKKFGKKKSHKRNYFYPQFIEHNQYLTSLLEKSKITTLIESILGKDPIYTGSDGNIFGGSTPWHRDYLLKQKSVKMLCYLESVNEKSGALRVIPGSHFVEDKFSNYLGDGLTWPEPPVEGGFDEKGFFGKGNNPTKFGYNKSIPNYVVKTDPGDVIVFSHNIIHCTNYALKRSFIPTKYGFNKKNIRRMFGMHFFSNPSNIKDKKEQKIVRDSMEELFTIEMDSFKEKNRFGPYVHNSESDIINNLTRPLKSLSLDPKGEFDGSYTKQSTASVDYCNRHKMFKYEGEQGLY